MDHPEPLAELKRLIRLNKAYNFMNKGDELLTEGKVEESMQSYSQAMEMFPDNAEMVFWPAVTLASTGKVEESIRHGPELGRPGAAASPSRSAAQGQGHPQENTGSSAEAALRGRLAAGPSRSFIRRRT